MSRMDSSSSSSRNSGITKQIWLASVRPGFFIQDDGFVSRTSPKPCCFRHLASPLAGRNAGSSRGLEKQPIHFPYLTSNEFLPPDHIAGPSFWKKQPSYVNYLTSNALPTRPDHNASSSAGRQHTLFAYSTRHGLPTLSDKASYSSRKQKATHFTFTPCNEMAALSTADEASSSAAAPKKQNNLLSLLCKPFTYAKFAFRPQKPTLPEFRSSNPCFDPHSRMDLNEPILPDNCVRCNQPFNLGKDGGIYMYKDEAYCSLDCRQEQMDIDNPPMKKREKPFSTVMIMAATTKKGKKTSAPQG